MIKPCARCNEPVTVTGNGRYCPECRVSRRAERQAQSAQWQKDNRVKSCGYARRSKARKRERGLAELEAWLATK